MAHLSSQQKPPLATSPPVGTWRRPQLTAKLHQWLAPLVVACRSRRCRVVVHTALILLGLVVQAAMLLTAAYLIDLAISLMELWAELAQQHLRITL